MSYFIVAISNGGGAPEQAYRKLQSAGACPERPFGGMFCREFIRWHHCDSS
jgi:ribosomal protein L34E